MKLDDYRTSDNVRDLGRGGGGGGFGGGGGMGGGLGLILSLVGSRFGIGGIALVLLGAWMLGMFGGGSSGVVSPAGQSAGTGAIDDPRAACAQTPEKRFSCQVLASTEDTWTKLFAATGQRYQPAQFRFFTNENESGCGAAQAAMGPFYCPSDNRIYIDTSFYTDLQTKFGAAGDFAQAYVIAHEVGHHIQTLTGTSDKVRAIQTRSSKAEGNALQVGMELQADCYAGVWAANSRTSDGQSAMSPGDAEEGLRAAQAIGDDTLQRSAGQRPVPESFTHGTSAQRTQWLKTGLESGNPASCDTFGGRLG